MKHLKNAGIPLLSILLVCFYPCGFLYFQNAGEARAVDMLPFFGIFLMTAAVIFLLSDLILRNMARAAVITNLAMLAVMHFTMVCNGIKSLLPGFRDKIFLIAVILILALLLWLLHKKKPNMTAVCGLFLIVFGVQVIIQGAMAAPTLISAAKNHRDMAALPGEALSFSGEKRNVYYMIFDEYGGSENLMHFYGYDNEAFLTGLEDRGFQVSRTSKNTESPWTVTLVPNMLNLDYVTSDEVPINNRLEWLKEPTLCRLLSSAGYQINLVNQNGFLDETGCHVLTRDQSEETISVFLYENSIFCLIPKLKWVIEDHVLHRGENGYLLALENARDAMINCAGEVGNGPTLTVCYLIAPHAPFLFDGAGELTAREDYYNWEKPELYLAKLQYISDAILKAVDNIQKHDPEAMIILQADHGVRIPGHLVEQFGGPWFDTRAEIPYMEGVLNCVYLPGATVDIEGDTCINATRKALDAAFGLNLGTIPVPPDYTIPDEYMPPPPDDQ